MRGTAIGEPLPSTTHIDYLYRRGRRGARGHGVLLSSLLTQAFGSGCPMLLAAMCGQRNYSGFAVTAITLPLRTAPVATTTSAAIASIGMKPPPDTPPLAAKALASAVHVATRSDGTAAKATTPSAGAVPMVIAALAGTALMVSETSVGIAPVAATPSASTVPTVLAPSLAQRRW